MVSMTELPQPRSKTTEGNNEKDDKAKEYWKELNNLGRYEEIIQRMSWRKLSFIGSWSICHELRMR